MNECILNLKWGFRKVNKVKSDHYFFITSNKEKLINKMGIREPLDTMDCNTKRFFLKPQEWETTHSWSLLNDSDLPLGHNHFDVAARNSKAKTIQLTPLLCHPSRPRILSRTSLLSWRNTNLLQLKSNSIK